MRPLKLFLSRDAGSASLEFITAGILLLVPLVYLVVALAALQGGALAVEGAARQAARVFVQSGTEDEGSARIRRAIAFGLGDYGVPVSSASTRVTCTPDPHHCLRRGGFVTVTV